MEHIPEEDKVAIKEKVIEEGMETLAEDVASFADNDNSDETEEPPATKKSKLAM